MPPPLRWRESAADLPRHFPGRLALMEELGRRMPSLGRPASEGGGLHPAGPIRGGRREAERLLGRIDPAAYGASRNHLDGAVTRLSPYIRHGVLTLAEVRDAVFRRLRQDGLDATTARRLGGRLISELGWRDYWQRLWRRWGDGIWHDREPLKTGLPAAAYAAELPADIREGFTGLACMDAFAADLARIGWLHNHARLWLAAYVVHWRRVRWQAGARWFLRHLLDGDPASNNLSWQWVASSFGARPYLFNRENLERFSGGRHCRCCPRAAGGCPFEASYDALQARLFAPEPAAAMAAPASPGAPGRPSEVPADSGSPAAAPPRQPVLWIHAEALGPANPALRQHPERPALFVFDGELIAGGTATTGGVGEAPNPPSPGRLAFLYECLLELPVTIRWGDVAEEVLGFARRHGADGVVTTQAVDPRFEQLRARIAASLPVQVLEPEPFVALPDDPARPLDLRRFSRYWKVAEPAVWSLLPAAGERLAGS
ncbi:MAG: deoxyribodipyrimidine photolyase [Cyanobium sp. CACIAM 14]|nr:MAG: deoxyribodipyrimidine photolyase [Cyanobium sp. CACIAM 14]